MILRTQDIESETNGRAHPAGSSQLAPQSFVQSRLEPILNLVEDVATRYEISALSGLLGSTRSSVGQDEISVAVLGGSKPARVVSSTTSSDATSFRSGWCRSQPW